MDIKLRANLHPSRVTCNKGARTITGTATQYNVRANASMPLMIKPGALKESLNGDLSRIKLMIDHDHSQPVGYVTSFLDDSEKLELTFTVVAGAEGDAALLHAADGRRDGLSVGLFDCTGKWCEPDGAKPYYEIENAVLRETSLCAIPAFDDARVSEVNANRQEKETLMDDQFVADISAMQTDQAPASPPPLAVMPPAPAPTSAPGNGLSFAAACEQFDTAIQRDGIGAVSAALADILPGDDKGNGVLRHQWIGEIWTPEFQRLFFTNLVQHARLTSGTKVHGYKIEFDPNVDFWDGNKTQIPTGGGFKTTPVEADVVRLAGGWDIDRILVDLGSPGFLDSFFRAAIRELHYKQEAYIGSTLLANAQTPDLGASSITDGVEKASTYLQSQGARMSWLALSPDLFTAFMGIRHIDAPWWLASNSPTPSLSRREGQIADLQFRVIDQLPPGTILAGDRRAATLYLHQPNPIRVQALDIPRGGIDIAIFAYMALLVNDARGLVRLTLPAGIGATDDALPAGVRVFQETVEVNNPVVVIDDEPKKARR